MHPLIGHDAAKKRLLESFRLGRLPQVILITGQPGVGKQRLALWLGQLILCQAPGASGPCDGCRACKLALDLAHADLHWFTPIPRLKAGEAAKQVDEAAELLAEAISARRAEPLYQRADGMSSHPMAIARLLLRRAALRPVEGARRIFVIGEAERLVTQESSPEAANALLKLLEEPPAGTWLVLTTPDPDLVLPTIRSRAVPLRLARLSDALVRSAAESLVSPRPAGPALAALVSRAEGSIGALLDDPEGAGKAAEEARTLLDAIGKGNAGRFERSLKQPPWSARGGFTDLLDALAEELAGQARESAGSPRVAPLTTALERVRMARLEAQGNVNPQLLLASLAGELARVL